MKNKSILGLFLLLLGINVSLSSCEDMLTPDMNRTAEGFTGKDTVNFYLGILRNVQGMIEQNILLGDVRSDLADTTTYASDSIVNIARFKRVADGDNALLNRSAYYKVINQCNFYLDKVDSMATKNNFRFMRKEMAQVLLIRAWTYMQLVQNYGRVPYITKPVSTANTGWEKEPEAWATPENLLELVRVDCEQARTYEKASDGGFPNYGSFSNGIMNIAHSSMLFPSDLVLGDLYLLRGASREDYIAAARHYYTYIKDHLLFVLPSDGTSYARISFSTTDLNNFLPMTTSWSSLFSETADKEIVTVVPSAANTVFGQMLTDIPQIYGFDPHSTNSTYTQGSTTDDGKDEVKMSGQVSILANYKSRQLAPSARYAAINQAQHPIFVELSTDATGQAGSVRRLDYVPNGDARYYGTAPEVRTEEGRFRFVQKYGASSSSSPSINSFDFRYVLGIYRARQIYLRYAEALNRAGYPRHAFAVLRGGMNPTKMPTLKISMEYDDENKTKWAVFSVDSVENGNNYISADELLRMAADPNYPEMADFSETIWANNVGIHDLGCGKQYDVDTLNTYEKMVGTRIEQEQLRRGASPAQVRKLLRRLNLKGSMSTKDDDDDSDDPSDDDDPLAAERENYTILPSPAPAEADPAEIDAVESLIADEGALETAFEGYRYYDLMRIARHKNLDPSLPAETGTEWMAWQIARRSLNLGLYEDVTNYDRAIYNLLLVQDNWYLQNPKY